VFSFFYRHDGRALFLKKKTFLLGFCRTAYPLIELARFFRETLLKRICLIDILSLNKNNLSKLLLLDNPQ